MNTYEFSQQWQAALDAIQVDEETGEATGYEALDALNLTAEEKLEFYGLSYKDLLGDANKIDEEIKRSKGRRDSLLRKADSMKHRADDLLLIIGKNKYSTPRVAYSYHHSEKVEITEMKDIPIDFTRQPPREPDKTAIRKAIKSGQKVPGAVLVSNKNLQIK